MGDYRHSIGTDGGEITSSPPAPAWLNGWGRWITAELAALRRESDWRWAAQQSRNEDLEARMRQQEKIRQRRFAVSPIDWARLAFAVAIFGAALAKRIAWPDAGSLIGGLLKPFGL